jgi:hypothetical protein
MCQPNDSEDAKKRPAFEKLRSGISVELGAIDLSETARPAVPGGDDIRPPNTSAAAVAYDKPPADDAGKVARLDLHRAW